MGQSDIVQSLANSTIRNDEHVKSMLGSSRTRLVWFVGISGFALLNGKDLWDSISTNVIEGINIFYLSLPWILSALFALVTHFLIDRAEIKFNKYINNKLSLIELHKAQVLRDNYNINEFELIVFDKEPELAKLLEIADKWINKVNLFEYFTFGTLVLGFIWSVCFPLFL